MLSEVPVAVVLVELLLLAIQRLEKSAQLGKGVLSGADISAFEGRLNGFEIVTEGAAGIVA